MRQEWCDKNPVARVETPRVIEKPISPLTSEEVSRLEAAVKRPKHRDMALSLHLMLYCGVRPTEVTRINPLRDIVGNELVIRPKTSKTGGGRVIPLRKVGDFLKKNPQLCHIPQNWYNRWSALRRSAGFTAWNADACLHTFATYHALYFKNISALQLEMGHSSPTLLRTRYVMGGVVKNVAAYWR